MASKKNGGSTAVLTAVLLIGFAIRVACLDCQSLWLDEAASAYWTQRSMLAFFRDAADNLHVPGYFLGLRVWVGLVGLSAFGLRYSSVLSGILLMPVAYRFTRRSTDSRIAPLIAATLAAASPAHIYYSQETRMYSLLPTLYLVMIAAAAALARRSSRRLWAVLLILELIALYLHLFSLLMVAAVNVLLAFAVWRRPRRSFIMPWIAGQALVALGLLPWLWFTWRTGGALPANLGDTSAGAAPFDLTTYLDQIWIFLATGLMDTQPDLRYWSMLLATLLGIVLPVVYWRVSQRARRSMFFLLVAFAIPLALGAIAWWFNPVTHPRYLFFLIAPFIILLAYALGWLLERRALLPFAAVTLLFVLVLNVTALRAAQMDPAQRRYDSAALAEAIARRGGSNDIVLMPPFDRALWYYDPAPVQAANWPFAGGSQAQRTAQLRQLLDGYDGVFLVEYHDLYSYDLQQQVLYLLETWGRLVEQFTIDRMDVYYYDLQHTDRPTKGVYNVPCGPLRLVTATFPQRVEPGNAVAIALRWQLQEPTSNSLVVSVRLMDGDDALSREDQLLLDGNEQRTFRWEEGTEANTYFVLPFPLGAPPLDYALDVIVYAENAEPLDCGDDGTALHLGHVSLAEADRRISDPYGTWEDTFWRDVPAVPTRGLTLEAYNVRPDLLLPGQPVYVTLRWRAQSEPPDRVHPILRLSDGEEVLDQAEGSLFKRYPTTRWRPDDLFIETREMRMPARLDPLQLHLAVEDEIAVIGEIRLAISELQWDVPPEAHPICAQFSGVGVLRGYEWQKEPKDGAATLTLYWKAAAEAPSPASYTVFAQLVAPDGWVLAQDDDLPVGGDRPTTTWAPGEVIADKHSFRWPGDAPPEASLIVGLYDLATLERVPAHDCGGNRLPDDAVSIPH